MKTLVVYYSLSGTTRTVARALAKALNADLEAIHCDRYPPNFWGRLRAAYDSWKNVLPLIAPLSHPTAQYDLVIVGGPVWATKPATPLRLFLRQQASRLPSTAFFLTHGGSPAQGALSEMSRLAKRAPVATLVVRQADVCNDGFAAAVASFAADLQARNAA